MKHDVSLEFNLTNPEELNIYNMIRNLEGIKNAISGFKDFLVLKISETKGKAGKDSVANTVLIPELEEIKISFEKFFKENGVTV